MWPNVNATPLPEGITLPAGLTVVDLVYNPLETSLLRHARLAGCRFVGGLAMLVHQGAASFELWTGRQVPVAVMRAAALAALEDSTPLPAPHSGAPEAPCSDS
jgi:shikimate dehydrogenase